MNKTTSEVMKHDCNTGYETLERGLIVSSGMPIPVNTGCLRVRQVILPAICVLDAPVEPGVCRIYDKTKSVNTKENKGLKIGTRVAFTSLRQFNRQPQAQLRDRLKKNTGRK